MTPKEIKRRYPSLCWKCKYSRNIADSLLEDGFCGCVYFLKVIQTNLSEDNVEEWIEPISQIDYNKAYSGWVLTRQKPFEKSTNDAMYNMQPQFKCCKQCPFFERLKESMI